jgi:hypothetical protein
MPDILLFARPNSVLKGRGFAIAECHRKNNENADRRGRMVTRPLPTGKSLSLPRKCCVIGYNVTYLFVINQFLERFETNGAGGL